mgnify:CR=1 FL=1
MVLPELQSHANGTRWWWFSHPLATLSQTLFLLLFFSLLPSRIHTLYFLTIFQPPLSKLFSPLSSVLFLWSFFSDPIPLSISQKKLSLSAAFSLISVLPQNFSSRALYLPPSCGCWFLFLFIWAPIRKPSLGWWGWRAYPSLSIQPSDGSWDCPLHAAKNCSVHAAIIFFF